MQWLSGKSLLFSLPQWGFGRKRHTFYVTVSLHFAAAVSGYAILHRFYVLSKLQLNMFPLVLFLCFSVWPVFMAILTPDIWPVVGMFSSSAYNSKAHLRLCNCPKDLMRHWVNKDVAKRIFSLLTAEATIEHRNVYPSSERMNLHIWSAVILIELPPVV